MIPANPTIPCTTSITVPCCQNAAWPTTLVATLSGTDDCDPCADGTVTLEWDAANSYWAGSRDVGDCDTPTFTIELRFGCRDDEPKLYVDVRGGDCGTWAPGWWGASQPTTCDPLSFRTGMSLADCCGLASGLNVDVTE